MKYLMLIATLFGFLPLSAQEGPEWKEPSKASQADAEYRRKPTIPPYGLAKIKALVKTIESGDADDMILNNKEYLALSLREKFTYHMIHAENNAQNCNVMPPVQDEDKKIFGQLSDAFDEYTWSDRQTKFLVNNRDSVLALIKESVTRSKRMGSNYKHAIELVNGREMIPFIIQTYNMGKKDQDLLTLLMLLMKNSEYMPFMTSQSYTKLYGKDANYQSYIDFNQANEALIIKRATDYYNTIGK